MIRNKEYIGNDSEKYDTTIRRIVYDNLRLSIKSLYKIYYDYALKMIEQQASNDMYAKYVSLYPSLMG